MERVVASCGLVCSACEAYVATQRGDWAELERVATRWREEYGRPAPSAESVRCDGCPGSGGPKWWRCAACGVRRCAMGKGVSTCAECDAYACAQLEEILSMAPEARAVLDGLRAGGT